ncbi:hypothetical protein AB6825_09930 [Serratia proteamaculans]|uniref:hypothetical protein n=1 Tax=Serratia proteamaculans TaxID=28151 RepID=UPI0039BDD8A9
MTISKWLLVVLCTASGLGGAALTGVIVSTGNDCAVVAEKIKQSDMADKLFKERPNIRGGAKGY